MKVSHQWLQTFFDKPFSIDGVDDALTDLGLEVEETMAITPGFTKVVIGEVLDRGAHPNADRLSLCTVNIGEAAPLSIVCGAKNVRAGLKVAVAMVGARLPNDIKIKRSKIRGIESEGMICASQELGLATESEGIMELPADAPVGTPFEDYVSCTDTIWDLSITPNRSDCLSHLGVARELAIAYASGFRLDAPEAFTPAIEDRQPVAIQDVKACPLYAGMVIDGIEPDAKTPLWLSERLHRCGIRTIHPVVDVTNYMMLEYGQPMHAFDAHTIQGEINVRKAKAGESVQLLNDEVLKLSDEDLLIADDEKIIALAGIMGAANTQLSDSSTRIVLESAYFHPDQIRKTAAIHRLHSESSHRFERGVDPKNQETVLIRAAHLIQSICGGQCGPAHVIQAKEDKTQTPIKLELKQVQRHLGIAFTSQEVSDYLGKIDTQLHHEGDLLEVYPPSYRVDLLAPIDIIEEIARIHGYNHFPTQSLDLNNASFYPAPIEQRTDQIVSGMLQLGYQETIHYAFVSDNWFRLIHGDNAGPLRLSNPLSDEYTTMRQSLWPGLLKSLVYNANRQHERIRLFEMGTCFMPDGEIEKIAGLLAGNRWPKQWGEPSEAVDFYDIKTHALQLTQWMGLGDVTCQPMAHPALHPHQSMGLFHDNICIGVVGRLSPLLCKQLKLNLPVMLFELDYLPKLHQRKLKHEPSEHPVIERDLALIVPHDCSFALIQACIQQAAGPLLKDCIVFDIYTDASDGSKGDKKMAFSLKFNDLSKTLTDSEVNSIIERVLNQLSEDLGISLRK